MTKEEIDQIKLNGSVKAIKEKIRSVLCQIRENNWKDIEKSNKYTKLEIAIEKTQLDLTNIKQLLIELNKLEPGNK